MRFACRLVFLLLFPLPAVGQQSSSAAQTAKDPAKGTIEGCVYRPDGQPLKYAKVIVWPEGEGLGVERQATDVSGHFTVDVLPGRYRVVAERSGYAPAMYGARTPNGMGTLLAVGPGERLRGIDVHLGSAAAVVGRAFDQEGEPLPGVRISVYAANGNHRRYGFIPASSAETDASGQFRLDGLTPGKYYLGAKATDDLLPPVQSDAEAALVYPPVFYPGVTDPAQAAVLDVRSGDELHADVTLVPVRAFRVRGRVLTPDPSIYGMVSLAPRDTRLERRDYHNGTFVDKDGTFEFTAVLPGAYTLTADVNSGNIDTGENDTSENDSVVNDTGGHQHFTGSMALDVGGDLMVEVATAPQAPLSCKVIYDTPHALDSATRSWVKVYFEGSEETQTSAGSMGPDETETELTDVPTGTFRLWAEAPAKGTYLKAARLNGEDALDRDVSITGAEGSLELVFGDGVATVTGTVRDSDGKPVPAALVELVPSGLRRPLRSLHAADTTDQQGRFILRDIAPGEYRIFARDAEVFDALGLVFGRDFDPDSIKIYEDRARIIRLAPHASACVELVLLTPP